MDFIEIAGAAGDRRSIARTSLDILAAGLLGAVLQPDDSNSGAAGSRPAVLVRAATPDDVRLTLRFVQDNGLAVSIRGSATQPDAEAEPGCIVLDVTGIDDIDVMLGSQ